MQIATTTLLEQTIRNKPIPQIPELVKLSFKKLAPFWPLKNLIAVNPLQGFEDLPIEEALKMSAAYFQQADLPEPIQAINRESIKWLQVYCDDGQATITMPLRKNGLYTAWRQLAVYDDKLHNNDKEARQWLVTLPCSADQAIAACLLRFGIANSERAQFLTLMLTTLPGWASYIKYRTEWAGLDTTHRHPITQADYLAFRLIITCLLWPEAKMLLEWHRNCLKNPKSIKSSLKLIRKNENNYHLPLLEKLAAQPLKVDYTPQAQLIFCIDVRSEPFRRALEAVGDYHTLGFAGFFGIPIQITDTVTGQSYASCPVLLSPKHQIRESPCYPPDEGAYHQRNYQYLTGFKKLYQSIKYTFTTPLGLVETLGIISGVWMGIRCFFPLFPFKLKTAVTQIFRKSNDIQTSLGSLTITEQCTYAETVLRMMGLTHHFSKLVVFCGHGSTTQNNAYATALDCGACGGKPGGTNARIMATILNQKEVRIHLALKNLFIPEDTYFIAAEHNTTTDEVILYGDTSRAVTQQLKQDLEKVRVANSAVRLEKMVKNVKTAKAAFLTSLRARDWSQVRPEWGLARNAAFIVGPRHLTQELDLEGRAFLHSYDWQQDPNGTLLTTILTAPMVVAQWINAQYLFSTLDNVSFGGGNKITQNVTGKIGVMQGNASDLMNGLPLQSVYKSDTQAYHEPLRLMTVVYVPRDTIDAVIQTQSVLQKLFGNGWVKLACIQPQDRKVYGLQRDLTWQDIH